MHCTLYWLWECTDLHCTGSDNSVKLWPSEQSEKHKISREFSLNWIPNPHHLRLFFSFKTNWKGARHFDIFKVGNKIYCKEVFSLPDKLSVKWIFQHEFYMFEETFLPFLNLSISANFRMCISTNLAGNWIQAIKNKWKYKRRKWSFTYSSHEKNIFSIQWEWIIFSQSETSFFNCSSQSEKRFLNSPANQKEGL